MRGYNTPDDCPWSSDMDYYDAKRGPFETRDDADEDPTPEDEISHCDSCSGECSDTYKAMTESGDEMARFCCLCANKNAPRSYKWEPCRECRLRMSAAKE